MFLEAEYEKKFRKAVKSLPLSLKFHEPEIENEKGEYKNWWKLQLEIQIDASDGSSFPSTVPITLYVSKTYPFCDYAVFPDDTSIRGHYHQDSQTGKLCIWPDYRIGFGENRLWRIILSTKQWLEAAAKDALISLEEPYEIPDFSCRDFRDFKLPRVLFDESQDRFGNWNKYFSKYGICEIGSVHNDAVLFIQRFKINSDIIYEYKWGTTFSDKEPLLNSIWILLKDEPLAKQRLPCRTWGEFKGCLSRHNINLRSLFIENYRKINPIGNTFYLILVGFPVKDKNKDPYIEIHWQPLLVRRWDILEKKAIRGFRLGHIPLDLLYDWLAKTVLFGDNEKIFWAKSTNIHYKRFFGRSMLSEQFTKLRIGLVGFGAVGSYVADLLVRQGIRELIVFDHDTIEPGNLCRHISGLEEIGLSKADKATTYLSNISPHLKVKSYNKKLPLQEMDDCWNDFLSCDLLIDCSASEAVFGWLSDITSKNNKRVVKIYITYGSKYLCMFGNNGNVSLVDIHNKIMSLSQNQKSNIPKEFFEWPSEMMLEGPGCWHPTFPARLDKILSLISYCIQRLDIKMQEEGDKAWAVIVGYQGDEKFGGKPIINCFFEGYL